MLHRIALMRVTCVLAAALLWAVPRVSAAETLSSGEGMKTTQVVLDLIAKDSVRVESRMRQNPPTLVLKFRGQSVSGSLPERSSIQHGVISEIQTQYRGRVKRDGSRNISEMRILLTGAYDYRIRTEVGRVTIEIDHPAAAQDTEWSALLQSTARASPPAPGASHSGSRSTLCSSRGRPAGDSPPPQETLRLLMPHGQLNQFSVDLLPLYLCGLIMALHFYAVKVLTNGDSDEHNPDAD